MLRDQDGEFEWRQLGEILDPTDYPEDRWEFILWMMQHPSVGLCFPLRDAEQRYLVPEALPKNSPYYDNWPGSLRFRYAYSHLPPGLIPRLIVEAHAKLTDPPTRWRMGAVFEVAECPVLVRGDPKRRRVEILVDGPVGQRRSALNIIRGDLERVHELHPEANAKAWVPLPAQPQLAVSYDHLRHLETIYGAAHRFMPDGAEREYELRELLDGVREGILTHRPPREHARWYERRGLTIYTQEVHMGDKHESTTISNSQNVATSGGRVAVRDSTHTVTIDPAMQLERDQFERDVNDILHQLADAQEALEAHYEPLRVALRKLNHVELDGTATLAVAAAKYEALLSEQDKSALSRLAERADMVATNIVSSGVWNYLIQPIITGVS